MEVSESCDLAGLVTDPSRPLSTAAILAAAASLLVSLLTTAYILGNMVYRRKLQLCYFSLFLLLLLAQLAHLALHLVSLLHAAAPACLPSLLAPLAPHLPALSHASLGTFAAIVAALTVERFLSSTAAGGCLRCCSNWFCLLAAVSAPLAVAALLLLTRLDILTLDKPLDREFWFGAEVGIYIILPLLVLTIFGTVNCCKVSMSSRLLPSLQIQAVKLNIGVTVCTNIALFVFLVQESLGLWMGQLEARPGEDDSEVAAALAGLEMATSVCSLLLCLVLALVPLLYCCICSTCCHGCCAAINQLEDVRYEPVESKDVH